jgi:Fe-S-cluster-containing hydrogenase component 2
MVLRNMVRINEEKCTGCGLCVPACAEGALKIIDGKARLTSDIYCDGLGACLGECPEGAITIEEREAEEFDEEAVREHLDSRQPAPTAHPPHPIHHSCPSAQVTHIERSVTDRATVGTEAEHRSELSQWPVQLKLLPIKAHFFENAHLLIAADCVPFAYANFHNDVLRGKTLVIGCPKLDDATLYKEKLTAIFKQNNIRSVTVVNMEVPCCFGLSHIVREVLDSSAKEIPLEQEIISIRGDKTPAPTERPPQLGCH